MSRGPAGGAGGIGGAAGAATSGGAGGMVMGGMGRGGSGGTGTGATGGGSTGGTGGTGGTIADLVGGLDGRFITMPCGDNPNTDDCAGAGNMINGGALQGCIKGALDAVEDFAIGGTAGQLYDVTMHFYGVMEPKNYGAGVKREAGDVKPNLDDSGSTPVPWAWSDTPGAAYAFSNYDTYEIHVYDNSDAVTDSWFINSDTGDGHYTFVINYEKTIRVVGGGKVRLRTYDANCRQIKNCGDGGEQRGSQQRPPRAATAREFTVLYFRGWAMNLR